MACRNFRDENWLFKLGIYFVLTFGKILWLLWIEFPFALNKIFSEGKASKIDEFVITEKKILYILRYHCRWCSREPVIAG